MIYCVLPIHKLKTVPPKCSSALKSCWQHKIYITPREMWPKAKWYFSEILSKFSKCLRANLSHRRWIWIECSPWGTGPHWEQGNSFWKASLKHVNLCTSGDKWCRVFHTICINIIHLEHQQTSYPKSTITLMMYLILRVHVVINFLHT